jgi:hypothetical protein
MKEKEMNNQIKHPPMAMWLLICLQLLLGLGALGGGGVMLAAPDGSLIQMPLSMLENSPFSNFLIPGVILFSLLGIYPVAVAYCLLKQPAWRLPEALNPVKHLHWSWAASLAAGIILLIWISTQVLLIQSIVFVHILYFVWGWVLILLTLNPTVRQHLKK